MTTQEIIFFIVKVLAGTGVFLVGVSMLTANIEQLSTSKIRKIFNKTANKKLVNVGIGTLTTAFIQSSGVTTVLIVGFVNVGLINLAQATALIMGANIGTTITAQIAALSAFPITTYLELLSFIGIMIAMLCQKDRTKKVGYIIAGLGLVFIGLKIMSDAMQTNRETLQGIFEVVTNPFFLLFIGILVTAIVQSSSATTSVIIAMSVAGLTIGTGRNEVLYIILGTNIGSCVTALMSSFGASPNAKRASLIHLLFNVFGSVLFFIFLILFPNFMCVTFQKWFNSTATQIAMFHTFFNVTCTIIFLPFSNLFVKLSQLIIKDKKESLEITYLDERIINSASLAITQLEKEMILLSDVAMSSFRLSYQSFVERDVSRVDEIQQGIDKANRISQNIINYLIKVSAKCTVQEEQYISNIHNSIGDIMRIAEIADNFTKYTRNEVTKHIEFSDQVMTEIKNMIGEIEKLYSLTKDVVTSKNDKLLIQVDEVEEGIDNLRKRLIDAHIERLNKGICKAESSGIFINLVSNLERLGDHLTYIAHSVIV